MVESRESRLLGRESRLIGREWRLIGRESRLIGRESIGFSEILKSHFFLILNYRAKNFICHRTQVITHFMTARINLTFPPFVSLFFKSIQSYKSTKINPRVSDLEATTFFWSLVSTGLVSSGHRVSLSST